ncbi:MAG: PKD domain-containing protein [Phycisphaerae bacterium]|nr:PKD domain-containing protein [Phycisphaerae bacterium]
MMEASLADQGYGAMLQHVPGEDRMRIDTCIACVLIGLMAGVAAGTSWAESPYLYGIHDHAPSPQAYLSHISGGGATGWVTATVAIGHNPNDHGGDDFSAIANQGHTVTCRLNNGYCPDGTIPIPSQYANFAQRCANYVAASTGCDIWIIGNETNLASEWPVDGGHMSYVSPQDYAECFALCYAAIKAVRPNAKVITQALAPFGGPYGPGTACGSYTHDGMPLNWVQYLYQTLTAVKNLGTGPDGIALHINSRGYRYEDIHSTTRIDAGGQMLYFSFYVYKDWVDYGIPSDLYHLPLYATECNGVYYWSGGHPENPGAHYEPGWMQEIHAEINRYNQQAVTLGKPVYRCINMYRWCDGCDGWNIDGSPYESQILSDLDQAVSFGYTWPSTVLAGFTADVVAGNPPLTVHFTDQSIGTITSRTWNFGDGDTDHTADPTHQYDVPGTYTVSLTVSGPGGSDVEVKTGYIVVHAVPGVQLVHNANFADSIAHWTPWIERNSGSDFSATTVNEQLRCTGSDYNGGVYQQFATGGAGTRIRISGYWKSSPVLANAQWGEILVINSARLPVNGVDETPATQADDIVIFKNDTWTTPAGWDGSMVDTAPVANLGQFVAAGDVATILIKSGNSGTGMTGLTADDLFVRIYITPSDLDRDSDVDLADFGTFQFCFNGPNRPFPVAGCSIADLDDDSDVDLADFMVFAACFNGPNREPACSP